MPQQKFDIGESFQIQFVWQIPNRDYIRAVFTADVTGIDTVTERYIIQLTHLLAKRQESDEGEGRAEEVWSEAYWEKVYQLVGKKAAVAYESIDQKPIRLKLQTLTLEHHYFTRYSVSA